MEEACKPCHGCYHDAAVHRLGTVLQVSKRAMIARKLAESLLIIDQEFLDASTENKTGKGPPPNPPPPPPTLSPVACG